MKLLLDMNIAPKWVAYLEVAGLSATHWAGIGSANAADAEIIAFSRSENFVIVTQDLDFTMMLALSRERKPSVVQIRADDASPETIVRSSSCHQAGRKRLMFWSPFNNRYKTATVAASAPEIDFLAVY